MLVFSTFSFVHVFRLQTFEGVCASDDLPSFHSVWLIIDSRLDLIFRPKNKKTGFDLALSSFMLSRRKSFK